MLDFNHLFEALIEGVKHIPVTLFITIIAVLVGSLLGLIIAFVRYYEVPILSPILAFLVTVIRGIPIVLMLLAFYLFLSEWINVMAEQYGWGISFKDVNAIYIALVPFIISATVQSSEIFRGALLSIDKGQFDAAKSIGLTRMQAIRRIILPQLLPVATPLMGNLSISLMKATSLTSMITVVEILMASLIVANTNYRYLESYLAAALVYWALSILIEQGTKYLENKQAHIVEGAVS